MKMSKKGMTREELFKKLDERRANDLNWKSGKVFGDVFEGCNCLC